MRTRYLVAALFVAIVSALLLVRHAGYLGGRAQGGPLKLSGRDAGTRAERGEIAGFSFGYDVDGDGVMVQRVRRRFASPGLEILGPVLGAGRCGGCRVRSWPPPEGGGPLEGAIVEGSGRSAALGLRARRRGIYYAQGLIADYKRGGRRFRVRSSGRYCISVGVGDVGCLGYTAPHKARVIEGGGPSRYGAKLRAGDDGPEARIPAVARHAIRITLANQTGEPIAVSGVGLGDEAPGDISIATDRARPQSFRLAPHGSQPVRLGFRFSGCSSRGLVFAVDRLRAELDGEQRHIPLSVKLAFAAEPCFSARR